jgi:hypothetical protein
MLHQSSLLRKLAFVVLFLAVISTIMMFSGPKYKLHQIVNLQNGSTLWSQAAGKSLDSEPTCQAGDNQRFEVIKILAVGDTFWYQLSPVDSNPYCHSGWLVQKDIPDQLTTATVTPVSIWRADPTSSH